MVDLKMSQTSQISPVKFAKFSRIPTFKNICERLLQQLQNSNFFRKQVFTHQAETFALASQIFQINSDNLHYRGEEGDILHLCSETCSKPILNVIKMVLISDF